MNELYSRLSKKLFFFIVTNIIESEGHFLFMQNKYAINKMSKCYVGKPNNRSLLKTASRFKNQELLDEIEQFSKINVKKKQGETN
jgi:hypothetical protein